jgi:predicted RNA binding protein YcfA (HicA-like mRNA interferase family)
MTSSELLRRLRRSGAQIVTGRGKGGHVMVLNGRRSFVPTGTGEIKHGTLLGILKALELRLDELK